MTVRLGVVTLGRKEDGHTLEVRQQALYTLEVRQQALYCVDVLNLTRKEERVITHSESILNQEAFGSSHVPHLGRATALFPSSPQGQQPRLKGLVSIDGLFVDL